MNHVRRVYADDVVGLVKDVNRIGWRARRKYGLPGIRSIFAVELRAGCREEG